MLILTCMTHRTAWTLTTHWGPAALQKDTRRCSPDFSVSSGPVHLRASQQHRGEILITVKVSKTGGVGIRRRTWTSDLLHRTQRKGGKTFYRHRQLQVLVSVQRDDVTDDTVIFTVWYFTSLLTNWQTSCVIRTEFKQDQHSIYLSSVTRIQRNVKVQFWVFPCSAASYFPSTRVSDSCNYQLICRQCL